MNISGTAPQLTEEAKRPDELQLWRAQKKQSVKKDVITSKIHSRTLSNDIGLQSEFVSV